MRSAGSLCFSADHHAARHWLPPSASRLSNTDQHFHSPGFRLTDRFAYCALQESDDADRMAYVDRDLNPNHIDQVRRETFTRSPSRPSGKLRRSPTEPQKALQRARGRLRTAAWRCSLDTKRKPESNVVAMALLAAVATRPKELGFDPASAGIVSAAFDDLVHRGYSRTEIEAVFRRFRKNLMSMPDFVSNEQWLTNTGG